MTEPTDHTPVRPPGGSPSIAEVAALTRRLRELSDQGRAADPAQRAEFLADKHALLARIADADHATGDATWVEMPEWMREQARHTAADTATGGSPPARRDDPAEIAARIAALRAQVAAHALDDVGLDTYGTGTDVDDDGAGWSR